MSYHHFFARNLTSRLHFWWISLLAYRRARRQLGPLAAPPCKQRLRQLKAELVFGLRYVRGNPF